MVSNILEGAGFETAQSIRDDGGDAVFVTCDVSPADQVEALVAAAVQEYGRLDIAVNSAGVAGDVSATAEIDETNWELVVAVNLKSAWLCMRHELKHMVRQGCGVIVNTSSAAAVVAERGLAGYAAA